MSQRDGFAGGFLAGTIFGSIVGGIIGAAIVSRQNGELTAEETELTNGQTGSKKVFPKRRRMFASDNEAMEMETARRSLEDKIAQLNATIDEVRQQLGNVNSSSTHSVNDPSLSQDF
jgi:predicted RNase H-like nuclease (RuvC/YqgF family)